MTCVCSRETLTWHANQLRIADEVRLANAFPAGSVAGGSDATDYPVALVLAASVNANLRIGTRSAGGALVRGAGTARERVSHLSRRTFAGRSGVGYNAHRSLATHVPFAFCGTKEKGC